MTDKQLVTLIDHLRKLKRQESCYNDPLPVIERHRGEISVARVLLSEVKAELAAGRQPLAGLEADLNSAVTDLMAAFAGFDGLEEAMNGFKATTAADPDGQHVNDAEVRARIDKLFIENNPVDMLRIIRSICWRVGGTTASRRGAIRRLWLHAGRNSFANAGWFSLIARWIRGYFSP